VPLDASALKSAAGPHISLDEVCPYRFLHALSPERAARLEGVELHLSDLISACQPTEDDFMLVEGAGGFYSPLTSDGLNADLAEQLGLDVLLVAADRLGCINHVLLSVEAIQSRGLRLLGIVLNSLQHRSDASMDNAKDLQYRLSCPVVSVGYDIGETSGNPGIEQIANLIMQSISR
jgi:dethiobiotin synthetase